MILDQNTICLQLMGGLGNQLFIWSAGQYLKWNTGLSVVYDVATISSGTTDHGVSIQDRNVGGQFVNLADSSSSIPLKLLRVIPKDLRRQIVYLKNLEKRLSPKRYMSPGPGYDEELVSLSGNTIVRGYFQSWKFLNNPSVKRLQGGDLLLRARPSNWYDEHRSQAVKTRPIIVHLRRGDYRRRDVPLGMLDFEYFRKALRVLDSYISSPVWVFSDEPNQAEELAAQVGKRGRAMVPPGESDAGESFALMSLGGAHIISNSSFSYWAAFLARSSRLVIYPRPWFQHTDSPSSLCPPHWLAAESRFLS